MIRIRELRLKKKMSQAALAKILDISQNTLSYWEREEYQPDNESIKKMVKYFNVTADYLLGITDKPDRMSPPELKEYGVEWISVVKSARAAGLSPEQMNELIETVKKLKR